MIIHLDRIRDEPFEWSQRKTIEAESLDRPELKELGEISWSGQVAAAPPGYRLQARLDYEQELYCTRCLSPVREPVASTVDLILMVRPAEPTVGEVQLAEQELGLVALDDERLDTTPILIEQIHLNVPMSVLCKPECKGLCPRCGSDLNRNPDCCEAEAVDPRWSALEDLDLDKTG